MIRKQDYPPDWPAISKQVRDEAHQCCEWCQAPNRAIIERGTNGKTWTLVPWIFETNGELVDTATLTWARLRFHRLSRIVLTVAHLDRNSHNNDRQNLAALCQRCHLGHDIRQHIANRRYGRYHTKEQQLQLFTEPSPAG